MPARKPKHETLQRIHEGCKAGHICPERTADPFLGFVRAFRGVMQDIAELRMDFAEAHAIEATLDESDRVHLRCLEMMRGKLAGCDREMHKAFEQVQHAQAILKEIEDHSHGIDAHVDRLMTDRETHLAVEAEASGG